MQSTKSISQWVLSYCLGVMLPNIQITLQLIGAHTNKILRCRSVRLRRALRTLLFPWEVQLAPCLRVQTVKWQTCWWSPAPATGPNPAHGNSDKAGMNYPALKMECKSKRICFTNKRVQDEKTPKNLLFSSWEEHGGPAFYKAWVSGKPQENQQNKH